MKNYGTLLFIQKNAMSQNVPNWMHHSKKDQKRKLKPQALRQAKARMKSLKKRLQKGDASFLCATF